MMGPAGPMGNINYFRNTTHVVQTSNTSTLYIPVGDGVPGETLILDRATFGNVSKLSPARPALVRAVACPGVCTATNRRELDLPVDLARESHVVLSMAPEGMSLYLMLTGPATFDVSVMWHVVR